YIFDHKGVFLIPAEGLDEDDFTLEVIDAGAEDVDNHDGYLIITTEKDDFGNMMKQLEKMNITPENASLQHIPKITTDKALEVGKKVLGLVDVLEDDDDVNAVYHNMTITDELIESEA
ncbi:MAG: YebC/PmpR family DNA-binding transcriptional regulator, partial [Bacteroidetes bacterium]|nr:YebC/PmpR family DNA-binding transcriptional regulator [Bacteroidota bacterium]